MQLNIGINEADILRNVEEAAMKRAIEIAGSVVREHFQVAYSHNYPAGPGTLLIKKSVETQLQSEEFQAKIDALVAKHLEKYAEEVAKDAALRGAKKIAQMSLETKLTENI